MATQIVKPRQGGTGINASAAGNGQLLIGNGSGFTLATLTAGTNVTVTNTAGGITIAASVQPRVLASSANSATPAINTDLYDMVVITGQTVNITSMTTGLSGTPTNGQRLWLSFTASSGTPTISWGTSFESSTVTLPTGMTTVRSDVGFVWNAATSKWRCIALA